MGKKILIGGIILIILIGAVLSYFFIFNQKQSSTEEVKANLVLNIVTPKDTYKIGEKFGNEMSPEPPYNWTNDFYNEVIAKKPLYGILEIDTISKDNYKKVFSMSPSSNFENNANISEPFISQSGLNAVKMTESSYETNDSFQDKGIYIYSIEIYSCKDLEKEFNQKCVDIYSQSSFYLPNNLNDIKSEPIMSKSKIITVTD